VLGIRVDGLCEESRTVYEFMGCYRHGHTCMPFRDVATLSGGETLAERYEQTLARLERLEAAGYAVRVQWECEFDPPDRGGDDREAEASRPLRTRDALYGGRTEAMQLHHRIRDGEETMRYVDVMSLYPWVCKYFKFPVGHPTIHLDCDDIPAALAKEWLVRCTVLPPRKLYHPVLPYRCRVRLLFCLCRSCAVVGSQEQCCHVSAADRALTATWVVDEVRLAVERGYRILRIYEFYLYEVTQYNPATGEGGLFVQYVDTFDKLKAEASGFPGLVQSVADQDRYLERFRSNEGILLDRAAVRKNADRRGLAKLCLNSFWGKLTECENRTGSRLVSEPHELYRFLAAPDVSVSDVLFANDDVAWFKWRYVDDEEHMPMLRHTNHVIGAYVTTGARLKLYSYLDALREMAVYCDTDSVIYIQPCGRPPAVDCGDRLGDMTDELSPRVYIEEFVSGGPKNYAYRSVDAETAEGRTVCKVRGITLNYAAALLVNFDAMRDMILDSADRVIAVRTERKI
jgi:hypothetical protein